jgi:hypothetical protein
MIPPLLPLHLEEKICMRERKNANETIKQSVVDGRRTVAVL